jgi:ATP-binding cassette subfamily C (CFTR/MRP) protein 1
LYVLYGAVQVLSLGAIVMPTTIKTEATVIAVVVNVLATLFLAVVSNLEHHRSPRPSSPIGTYLVVTWIFDAARVRTLDATEFGGPLRNIAAAAAVIKLCLVILELKEKRAWLRDPKSFPAPESTANFFNRMTYFWVNPMLMRGYSHPIQEHNLPEVQDQIIGEKHLLSFAEKWEQRE